MIPAAFDYQRPASLDEALKIIAADDGAKVLAGGMSLLPLLKLRLASADRLVDIGRLTELRGVRDLPDGGYEVGALTTYAEHRWPARSCRAVADAVEHIGDVQVRNRGTVGGAIAHATRPRTCRPWPSRSTTASVLRSRRGERVVPLDGFFEGAVHDGDGAGRAARRDPPRAAAGRCRRCVPEAGSNPRPATRSSACRGRRRVGRRVDQPRPGRADRRRRRRRTGPRPSRRHWSAATGRPKRSRRRPTTRPTARRSTATSTPIASTGPRMAAVYTRRAIEARARALAAATQRWKPPACSVDSHHAGPAASRRAWQGPSSPVI